jgi:2-dehydro-3-deoxygluconokinase
MTRIVTFGEVMGRLCPHGAHRLQQCLPGSLEMTFGGAEANVAASLALLGAEVSFVTALPDNVLGDACIRTLRGLGVSTDHIIKSNMGRLGLYFLESGANQRPSHVVYDRGGSAITVMLPEAYDWPKIFQDKHWLHITGITPSLSQNSATSTLEAAKAAKAAGLEVSCDLNFRKKLWRWDGPSPRELAEKTMRAILPYVDLVIANEEDCHDVLNIYPADTDVHSGQLAIDRYPDVARQVVLQFPNVSRVAITLRESISASHNNWGAMLYSAEDDSACFAPLTNDQYKPFEIRNIVDRVGAGDAFAAGLVFALSAPDSADHDNAISFAVAASCLAHSIVGDFNYSTRSEIEALMHGPGTGRVVR